MVHRSHVFMSCKGHLCSPADDVTEGSSWLKDLHLVQKKRRATHNRPIFMLLLQPGCKTQLDGAEHQAISHYSLPWKLNGSQGASVQQAPAAACQCRRGKQMSQTLKPEKAWCSAPLYCMVRYCAESRGWGIWPWSFLVQLKIWFCGVLVVLFCCLWVVFVCFSFPC